MGILGGATPTWFGGAGNLTIQSGTGNSRRLAVQTTTSGGVATTFLRANELQQALFADGAAATPAIGWAADSLLGFYRLGTAGAADTIAISANGVQQIKIAAAGILRLPLLPAEGSTKNAMCWDGVTFNVTQNAAATCTVSSARFKQNIRVFPVADARRIVNKLHASSYSERQGGRLAIGIIAEQADSADWRLASRDTKGRVTSTNYEEVTSLLVTVVKDQQRVIDSLRAAPTLRSELGNPWLLLAVGGAAVATAVAARRKPAAIAA